MSGDGSTTISGVVAVGSFPDGPVSVDAGSPVKDEAGTVIGRILSAEAIDGQVIATMVMDRPASSPVAAVLIDGPSKPMADSWGPVWAEHTDWLRARFLADDGRGYDRRRLAADPTSAHLARLPR